MRISAGEAAVFIAFAAIACGGGHAGSDPVPKCLRDLFAACPLEGACQAAPNVDGGSSTCFASGVLETATPIATCPLNGGGNPSAMAATEVRKGNGALCYTRLDTCICGHACEDGTRIWNNDLGQEVAVETFSLTNWSIRCSDTAETVTCGTSQGPACGGDPAYQTTNCTAGTCP